MKYIVGLLFTLVSTNAFALNCPHGEDWFNKGKCYEPASWLTPPQAPQAAPASQGVRLASFTTQSVYRRVQCELGQLGKLKGLPAALKARFKYTAAHHLGVKAGASAELGIKIASVLSGPSVGVEGGFTNNTNEAVENDFNIDPDNVGKWCAKGNQPPVNVYACLSPKIDFLESGKGSCFYSSESYGKLSANGKVIIWFINVGPSFEWDVKKTYTIAVSAPPQDVGAPK